MHAAATGLIGVVAWQSLVGIGALPHHDDARLPRPRSGSFVTATACGMALAVVWEILEWIGHTWIDDSIQVGYNDTVGDLVAGSLGAVVAALLVSRTSAAEPR